MTDVHKETTTRRQRSGGVRNTKAGRSSQTRSSRGGRQPAEQVLAELEPMISILIKENRELRRQIDRLSKQSVRAASGTVERTLQSLERRGCGSLDGEITTGGRRSTRATSVPRERRKVTDPELLERRREALAKARAVRAAKRASAQP
jgi:hypothetical protein